MSLRVPVAAVLLGACLALAPAASTAAAAGASTPSVPLTKGHLARPRIVDVASVAGANTAHREVERQELTPGPSLAEAATTGSLTETRPAARSTAAPRCG